ncbi:MAG: hypothetical protein ACLP3R_17915 [Candidatus Korobacteraceae bacterium]
MPSEVGDPSFLDGWREPVTGTDQTYAFRAPGLLRDMAARSYGAK